MSPLSLFQLIALIFSVMVHEIAHGYVAERLGDPTARLAGRLTLNPLKHIDIFGSILLPFILILTHSPIVLGWAKPVPYNPSNLTKDMKYGPLKVALAGPFTNIGFLVVLGILARFGMGFLSPNVIALLGVVAYLNIFLAIFNLVPIPPLDGSKILPHIFPRISTWDVERFGNFGIFFVFVFLYFFSTFISSLASAIFVLVAGPEVLDTMLQVLRAFS